MYVCIVCTNLLQKQKSKKNEKKEKRKWNGKTKNWQNDKPELRFEERIVIEKQDLSQLFSAYTNIFYWMICEIHKFRNKQRTYDVCM